MAPSSADSGFSVVSAMSPAFLVGSVLCLKPIPSHWGWVIGFCDWPGLDHVTTAGTGARVHNVSERGDVAPTCKPGYSFQTKGNRWLINKNYRQLLSLFGEEPATHWLGVECLGP